MSEEIDPLRNLKRIQQYGPLYAKAKAERMYLEEFRKTKKALLMRQAEQEGQKTAAGQEREAYADAEYQTLLEGLRMAVEEEEMYRWRLTQATTAIEVWRSKESTNRAMDRSAA